MKIPGNKNLFLLRSVYLIRLLVIILILFIAGIWIRNVVESNFKVVVPGLVYRSAQPRAGQLDRWIHRYGIKTIVNLRGNDSPDYQMEEEISTQHHIQIYHIQLSAYQRIASQRLNTLIDILESAPRPILLHCREGNDRSGTASALAAWMIGQEDYALAKKQAYVLPGPWKHKKGEDHISHLFDDYESWCREHDREPGFIAQFKEWASEIYHPSYYYAQIEGPQSLSVDPGQQLTIDCYVTNRAEEAIPAGNSDCRFELYSLITLPGQDDFKMRAFSPIPQRDLAPGQVLHLIHTVEAPWEPGDYQMMVDLREVPGTPFVRRGSPVLKCLLTVNPAGITGKSKEVADDQIRNSNSASILIK